MRCLPPDDVIAALESAVFLRVISRAEFEDLRAHSPTRLRATLAQAEIGAQSGYETHARLRLRRAGFVVRSQVYVPGAGHLDNVIDDLVDLETDGREFHQDSFFDDRRRDLAVQWMGLRVLRIPATLVDTDWDYVEETVSRMVLDGRRRHDPRGRRKYDLRPP
jgi:very-short-patch-repair endonuclease